MSNKTKLNTATAEVTKDGRPYWKEADAIRTATRYANSLCNYANRAVIPLLRLCELPITDELVLSGLGGFGTIEDAFADAAIEPGLSDFLKKTVEDEARLRFSEYKHRFDGIKKPLLKVFFYSNGDKYVYLEDVIDTLELNADVLRPDIQAIEARYTHYLTDEDLAYYERQKKACDALNDLFRGRADLYAFTGAFVFMSGEVFPNTKFNYNILKPRQQ